MTEEKDSLSISDEQNENDDDDDLDEDFDHLPALQGTLCKWTNYIHGWQDRFIVLNDGTLSYYKSENETEFGCRGAISLSKTSVTPHQFDECRFDVSVNDNVWYLRACNEEERQHWINALELHRQAESGYGSENNLRRHGSVLSLTSGTSLSTASNSSFKRGRGLREKLAEMETFKDILCRQVETLQSYFDTCASAIAHGTVHDLTENEDLDDANDDDEESGNHASATASAHGAGIKGRDLASILQQHGGHAFDFKGEAFTFKATTAGIIATMAHCIELMGQREDSWRKRYERETERRKKYEEAYKTLLVEKQKPIIVGGPDYEEGPHCAIKEDEFFDAVDAALDKMEIEDDRKHRTHSRTDLALKLAPKISLSPSHKYYTEISTIGEEHLRRLNERTVDGLLTWQLITDDGDLKVYKREIEENGIVIDPIKAVYTVKGITGHEVCHIFWDVDYRMGWDATLDASEAVEWLSEDTFISHNVLKRLWPATQRDALFWSHLSHVTSESDEGPDRWMVVNYSCESAERPVTKYVRLKMNVSMICETVIDPPDTGEITRDNITCNISYTADINPGGWAPASVLRQVYKREYPRFLKRFATYVKDITASKPIMF